MNRSFKPPFSFLPSLDKKTTFILSLVLIWVLIVVKAMEALGGVAYEQIRLINLILVLGIPVALALVLNSRPPELAKKTSRKFILSLLISFSVYAILFLLALFGL